MKRRVKAIIASEGGHTKYYHLAVLGGIQPSYSKKKYHNAKIMALVCGCMISLKFQRRKRAYSRGLDQGRAEFLSWQTINDSTFLQWKPAIQSSMVLTMGLLLRKASWFCLLLS